MTGSGAAGSGAAGSGAAGSGDPLPADDLPGAADLLRADDPPGVDDLLNGARIVALPLRTRFRGLETREAMLLRGPHGWTEFSPFAEYDDAESAAWLEAAIDFGWRAHPTAVGVIPVNGTLPAVDVAEVAGVLARFPGVRTVKVKVAERGRTLADDIARIDEVRRLLGPEGRIRIDANGAWNVDEAETALRRLSHADLEYAEQPCATVPELAELRDRVRDLAVPIAADESVRRADDPLAVAREGAADLLVVKAQPLGGITRARRIVAEAGLPVVVSSALDTSVGLAMGAHLAAALGDAVEYDCGLGTAALLAADVTSAPLLPVDGVIEVRRVDADRADAVLAPDERAGWWRERLERCRALLDARRAPDADPGAGS